MVRYRDFSETFSLRKHRRRIEYLCVLLESYCCYCYRQKTKLLYCCQNWVYACFVKKVWQHFSYMNIDSPLRVYMCGRGSWQLIWIIKCCFLLEWFLGDCSTFDFAEFVRTKCASNAFVTHNKVLLLQSLSSSHSNPAERVLASSNGGIHTHIPVLSAQHHIIYSSEVVFQEQWSVYIDL